jgi:hypothetical protein
VVAMPAGRTWRVIQTLIAAISIGLCAALVVDYMATKQQLRRDAERLALLSESIDQLRNRAGEVVRVVEKRVEVRSETGAAGGAAPELDDEGQERAEQEPLQPPSEQAIAARFDQRYAVEELDRSWAFSKSKELERAAAAVELGQRVHEIGCRSSLCRVDASFADTAAHNRFMDEVAARMTGGDGLFSPNVEQHEDGSLRSVAYWIRAGHLAELTSPL